MAKERLISAAPVNDGSGKQFVVFMGKSDLERPESDKFAQGSVYIDTDTGKRYLYDEEDGWPQRSE